MYVDMLNHYSLKITELSDIVADAVSKLNTCVVLAEESWKSPAVLKFNDKVLDMQKQIKDIDRALENLAVVFNTIKNNELESSSDNMTAVLANADIDC